jgi:5-methylcytosine-specific restriction endonuclease McrA
MLNQKNETEIIQEILLNGERTSYKLSPKIIHQKKQILTACHFCRLLTIGNYCSGSCKEKHQKKLKDKKSMRLNKQSQRKPRFRKGLKKEFKPKLKQLPLLKTTPKIYFYDSREWMELRYKALKLYGRKCACCFATNVELHVDHIKPRSKYPELELDIKNLQILCRACNLGKLDKDEIQWRA